MRRTVILSLLFFSGICSGFVGCWLITSRWGYTEIKCTNNGRIRFRGYKYLEPASLRLAEYACLQEKYTIQGIIQGIQRRTGNTKAMDKYVNFLKHCVIHSTLCEINDWQNMKRKLRKCDRVYYFEYERRIYGGTYSDFGILVIREGNVVFRLPFETSFSSDNISGTEIPGEDDFHKQMRFDRLGSGG